MRDIQTEIECINMRIDILSEESTHLYKLLGNFQHMDDISIEDMRAAILDRLQKRKIEIKNELNNLHHRVKMLDV